MLVNIVDGIIIPHVHSLYDVDLAGFIPSLLISY